MKNKFVSMFCLLALLFGAQVSAYDESDKKSDEEQAEGEGEVEEAKNSLNLQEASVDGLFLDTVVKVVGGLLSKGGMPAHKAKKMAEDVAEDVKQAHAEEGNSLSLNEVNVSAFDLKSLIGKGLSIATSLLSKGKKPKHAHDEAVKAMEEEAAQGNSLNLVDASVDAFDFGKILKTGAGILGSLLSKGVSPKHAHEIAAAAAAEAHGEE